MATPLLIDTDMDLDDAAALALALASPSLDVRAVVAVGGHDPPDRVVRNVGRELKALAPPIRPAVARGLEPAGQPAARGRIRFGVEGWSDSDLPEDDALRATDFRAAYRSALDEGRGELVVLALGPLTNLAAILRDSADATKAIRRVHIAGGAVWTQGDAAPTSEFNFHRDPHAAATVLASGLSIAVTPLDVTRLVCIDESHIAHLAASGCRTGETLARLLRIAVESNGGPGLGKAHLHAAVALGGLLWPDLFLKTRMRLEVITSGPEVGRCRPQLGGDKTRQVDLLTAVNAVDFLENLLEALCHEAFVV